MGAQGSPLSHRKCGVAVQEGQLLLQAADAEGQVTGGQDQQDDAAGQTRQDSYIIRGRAPHVIDSTET